MNRKIAISSVSILASLALLGVGVYAADLTDATSTANTLSSSNPHLQIAAGPCPEDVFSDSISNGLNAQHIAPGNDQVTHFCLKNTGDTDLTLSALFVPTGVGAALGTVPGHLENDLNVTFACTDTTVANTQAAGPAAFKVYEVAQTFTGSVLKSTETADCTLTSHLTVLTDFNQNLTYNATFGGN